MTDRSLIERFLAGDSNAFNQLVWKWEHPIYNFILRNTGDNELTKDLCQVTFMQVYKKLGRLKEKEKFSSWIYRIAVNQCYDEFKKRKRFRGHGDTTGQPEEVPDQGTALTDPERICHQNQIKTILQDALLTLPEEQRIIIVMKQYQGLKFTEIAETLQQPVNTVKSRMYYGLRALKKYLVEQQFDREVLLDEM
ncbi:sigma-70 family RNA polymerase sigma factor [bacterium]|nr:sigma-70 family RNA polymerase sigma factor [bacterium]